MGNNIPQKFAKCRSGDARGNIAKDLGISGRRNPANRNVFISNHRTKFSIEVIEMHLHNLILEEDELHFLKKIIQTAKINNEEKENDELFEKIETKLSKENITIPKRGSGYLDDLSDENMIFFNDFKKEYNLNLYHSIAAIIENYKPISEKDLFSLYLSKYGTKRPLILEHQDELKQIIHHVINRLKYKKKIYPSDIL